MLIFASAGQALALRQTGGVFQGCQISGYTVWSGTTSSGLEKYTARTAGLNAGCLDTTSVRMSYYNTSGNYVVSSWRYGGNAVRMVGYSAAQTGANGTHKWFVDGYSRTGLT